MSLFVDPSSSSSSSSSSGDDSEEDEVDSDENDSDNEGDYSDHEDDDDDDEDVIDDDDIDSDDDDDDQDDVDRDDVDDDDDDDDQNSEDSSVRRRQQRREQRREQALAVDNNNNAPTKPSSDILNLWTAKEALAREPSELMRLAAQYVECDTLAKARMDAVKGEKSEAPGALTQEEWHDVLTDAAQTSHSTYPAVATARRARVQREVTLRFHPGASGTDLDVLEWRHGLIKMRASEYAGELRRPGRTALQWGRCGEGLTVDRDAVHCATEGDRKATALANPALRRGRHIWEIRVDKLVGDMFVGIAPPDADLNLDPQEFRYRTYYLNNGVIRCAGEKLAEADSSRAIREGDTIRVDLDLDRGTIDFHRNGTNVGVQGRPRGGFANMFPNGVHPIVTFEDGPSSMTLINVGVRRRKKKYVRPHSPLAAAMQIQMRMSMDLVAALPAEAAEGILVGMAESTLAIPPFFLGSGADSAAPAVAPLLDSLRKRLDASAGGALAALAALAATTGSMNALLDVVVAVASRAHRMPAIAERAIGCVTAALTAVTNGSGNDEMCPLHDYNAGDAEASVASLLKSCVQMMKLDQPPPWARDFSLDRCTALLALFVSGDEEKSEAFCHDVLYVVECWLTDVPHVQEDNEDFSKEQIDELKTLLIRLAAIDSASELSKMASELVGRYLGRLLTDSQAQLDFVLSAVRDESKYAILGGVCASSKTAAEVGSALLTSEGNSVLQELMKAACSGSEPCQRLLSTVVRHAVLANALSDDDYLTPSALLRLMSTIVPSILDTVTASKHDDTSSGELFSHSMLAYLVSALSSKMLVSPPQSVDDVTAIEAAAGVLGNLRLALTELRFSAGEGEAPFSRGEESRIDVQTHVLETPHNYYSNMNWRRSIEVPGAPYLELSFDSRCRTESGCDKLKIYKVENGQLLRTYHGPSGWSDFRVNGSRVYLHFHSDGSVEDWGFKVTITGFPLKEVCETLPRFQRLETDTMASLARCAISLACTPVVQVDLPDEMQARAGELLKQKEFQHLLSGGIVDRAQELGETDEKGRALLQSLVNMSNTNQGAKLVEALREATRLQTQPVRDIPLASFILACYLHKLRLTCEAVSSMDSGSLPTQPVISAWKSAVRLAWDVFMAEDGHTDINMRSRVLANGRLLLRTREQSAEIAAVSDSTSLGRVRSHESEGRRYVLTLTASGRTTQTSIVSAQENDVHRFLVDARDVESIEALVTARAAAARSRSAGIRRLTELLRSVNAKVSRSAAAAFVFCVPEAAETVVQRGFALAGAPAAVLLDLDSAMVELISTAASCIKDETWMALLPHLLAIVGVRLGRSAMIRAVESGVAEAVAGAMVASIERPGINADDASLLWAALGDFSIRVVMALDDGMGKSEHLKSQVASTLGPLFGALDRRIISVIAKDATASADTLTLMLTLLHLHKPLRNVCQPAVWVQALERALEHSDVSFEEKLMSIRLCGMVVPGGSRLARELLTVHLHRVGAAVLSRAPGKRMGCAKKSGNASKAKDAGVMANFDALEVAAELCQLMRSLAAGEPIAPPESPRALMRMSSYMPTAFSELQTSVEMLGKTNSASEWVGNDGLLNQSLGALCTLSGSCEISRVGCDVELPHGELGILVRFKAPTFSGPIDLGNSKYTLKIKIRNSTISSEEGDYNCFYGPLFSPQFISFKVHISRLPGREKLFVGIAKNPSGIPTCTHPRDLPCIYLYDSGAHRVLGNRRNAELSFREGDTLSFDFNSKESSLVIKSSSGQNLTVNESELSQGEWCPFVSFEDAGVEVTMIGLPGKLATCADVLHGGFETEVINPKVVTRKEATFGGSSKQALVTPLWKALEKLYGGTCDAGSFLLLNVELNILRTLCALPHEPPPGMIPEKVVRELLQNCRDERVTDVGTLEELQLEWSSLLAEFGSVARAKGKETLDDYFLASSALRALSEGSSSSTVSRMTRDRIEKMDAPEPMSSEKVSASDVAHTTDGGDVLPSTSSPGGDATIPFAFGQSATSDPSQPGAKRFAAATVPSTSSPGDGDAPAQSTFGQSTDNSSPVAAAVPSTSSPGGSDLPVPFAFGQQSASSAESSGANPFAAAAVPSTSSPGCGVACIPFAFGQQSGSSAEPSGANPFGAVAVTSTSSSGTLTGVPIRSHPVAFGQQSGSSAEPPGANPFRTAAQIPGQMTFAYQPTTETDSGKTVTLHHISAMPTCQNFSPEEIRFADSTNGVRGEAAAKHAVKVDRSEKIRAVSLCTVLHLNRKVTAITSLDDADVKYASATEASKSFGWLRTNKVNETREHDADLSARMERCGRSLVRAYSLKLLSMIWKSSNVGDLAAELSTDADGFGLQADATIVDYVVRASRYQPHSLLHLLPEDSSPFGCLTRIVDWNSPTVRTEAVSKLRSLELEPGWYQLRRFLVDRVLSTADANARLAVVPDLFESLCKTLDASVNWIQNAQSDQVPYLSVEFSSACNLLTRLCCEVHASDSTHSFTPTNHKVCDRQALLENWRNMPTISFILEILEAAASPHFIPHNSLDWCSLINSGPRLNDPRKLWRSDASPVHAVRQCMQLALALVPMEYWTEHGISHAQVGQCSAASSTASSLDLEWTVCDRSLECEGRSVRRAGSNGCYPHAVVGRNAVVENSTFHFCVLLETYPRRMNTFSFGVSRGNSPEEAAEHLGNGVGGSDHCSFGIIDRANETCIRIYANGNCDQRYDDHVFFVGDVIGFKLTSTPDSKAKIVFERNGDVIGAVHDIPTDRPLYPCVTLNDDAKIVILSAEIISTAVEESTGSVKLPEDAPNISAASSGDPSSTEKEKSNEPEDPQSACAKSLRLLPKTSKALERCATALATLHSHAARAGATAGWHASSEDWDLDEGHPEQGWSFDADSALVSMVDSLPSSNARPSITVPKRLSAIVPDREVRGVTPADLEDYLRERLVDRSAALLAGRPAEALNARYSRLLMAAEAFVECLAIVGVREWPEHSDAWTIVSWLPPIREVIASAVRQKLWMSAVDATRSSVDVRMKEYTVDRLEAAHTRETSQNEPAMDGKLVFTQLHAQMRQQAGTTFRTLQAGDQAWRVRMLGFAAQDAGGPFRDTVTEMMEELQSPCSPLLALCPDGRDGGEGGMDIYVLRTGPLVAKTRSLCVFLGQLMGMAVRAKVLLPLNLAPFVWKRLVRETVTVENVLETDRGTRTMLKYLRETAASCDEATAEQIIGGDTWTCHLSDGTVHNLLPGGGEREVLPSEINAYIEAIERARVGEAEDQLCAVREGLVDVLPGIPLELLRWSELEEAVCGRREVSLDELQACVQYEGSYSESHEAVVRFWQAMASFTAKERGRWLRFTTGRARLPPRGTRRFKIIIDRRPHRSDEELQDILPTASTCSSAFHLPSYRSVEEMASKIRIAISCADVDGD